MPRNELRERLAELHAELERHPQIDAESRRLLATLSEDIHAVLEDEQSDATQHVPLVERLAEAVRSFEESHTQLAAAVNRVATALSNLGI